LFASRGNPAKKFKHFYWIATRNGASNDGLTGEAELLQRELLVALNSPEKINFLFVKLIKYFQNLSAKC